jgi:short-subunit dehydrogenase involved in D-alanine esterification of teichoic acids
VKSARELRGARVLVTGGTSGIGAAYVDAFAKAGSQVIACGRNADAVQRLSARVREVRAIAADVASDEGRARLRALVHDTGGLDILVHNAGVMEEPDFAAGRVDLAAIRRELEINVFAPMALTHELLPFMPRHAGAAIVLVTSGYALLPPRRAPTYAATKAALRSFGMGLRYQLEPLGIHVMEVLPPLVDTPRTASNTKPKLSAERVVADTLSALKAGRWEVPVGQVALLRMLMRVAPAAAARLMRDR